MFRKNSCFYASSPSFSCASQRAVYLRPKYSNQNFCNLIWFRGLFELRTILLIYLFRSFELFFLLQIDFLLLFCLLGLYYNMNSGIKILLYHLWLICGLNFKNWFEWILLFLSFGPFKDPRFNQPISSVYKILDWRKHHAVPKSLNGQIIYLNIHLKYLTFRSSSFLTWNFWFVGSLHISPNWFNFDFLLKKRFPSPLTRSISIVQKLLNNYN